MDENINEAKEYIYIRRGLRVVGSIILGNARASGSGTGKCKFHAFIFMLLLKKEMLFRNLFHSEKIHEFLRFCFVGVLATGIHYGIYLLLIKTISLEGNFWINAAYLVGFIISWLCNLWMTAKITFKTHISLKRGVGFAVTHGINYLLHVLFLNIFLALGITEQIAPIPVYCCVVPINFILVRTVFKSNKIQ